MHIFLKITICEGRALIILYFIRDQSYARNVVIHKVFSDV